MRLQESAKPEDKAEFFRRTLEMQQIARTRYSSFEHLIDKKGKVFRFEDDPPSTWTLMWFETQLIKDKP